MTVRRPRQRGCIVIKLELIEPELIELVLVLASAVGATKTIEAIKKVKIKSFFI